MNTSRLALIVFTIMLSSCGEPKEEPLGIHVGEWEVLNDELMELYRTGQYDRSVVVAKKALEVAKKNVGPDHPNFATSLNNLAWIYNTQGHYAQAEPLVKQALAIDEKNLGPNHPYVALSLNNLAGLYRAMGRDDEAEPLEQRASHIESIER